MKVSIITVSYNSAETILKTIESVNSQTYENIEHIFIDGNSTDNTVEIIEENAHRNVKLISERDTGIYNAMNKGVMIASGELVHILNSDDHYTNDKVVEYIVNCFGRDLDYVFSGVNYIDENNRVIRNWRVKEFKRGSYRLGWHVPHPGFWCTKNVYDSIGSFDESMKVAADFDFMMRVMESDKSNGIHFDEITVNMLLGGESNGSIKSIIRGNRDVYRSFKKNRIRVSFLYTFMRLWNKIPQFKHRIFK